MRTRRALLKDAVVGVSALLLSPALAHAVDKRRTRFASGTAARLKLTVTEALHEMADTRRVYSWAFQLEGHPPTIPGPVLMVEAGQTIVVELTNTLDEPHAFALTAGRDPVFQSAPVAPGTTSTFQFTAPAAGSWLYFDPLNAPVNRVLGLHGALVSMPPAATTGKQTPYANPPAPVQRLFDDLGSAPLFPGNAWDPNRSFVWLFTQLDPRFNAQAEAGETVDAASMSRTFLPRYFTINGRSGVFAAHAEDTEPHGNEGQPVLLRSMNAGLATHSPHIHGNHVYQTARKGVPQDNVLLLDTWDLPPLTTVDLLLPFQRPPDATVWPPVEEGFPQQFVMHCHTEMSQTAAGGNYPFGAVTHFHFDAPLTR